MERNPQPALSRTSLFVLVLFPALKLMLHLFVAFNSVDIGYDYHRDELYYLVCADRLDWGYVDHPPVSVAILAVTRLITGDSVAAIRIVPAIAGALTVFFVGLMARDLGGRGVALALAMMAALAAPFYLALDAFYSMNALDVLIWAVAAWLLIQILRQERAYLWVALGVLLGIGLENKIGVLWLCAGLFVGLLLSPQRQLLKTRGPWVAAMIAVALSLPYVFWQAMHRGATLEFMRNATADKLVWQSLPSILSGQLSGMLSAAAVTWLSGLLFFLWLPEGRRFRPLGWAFLTVFAILAAAHTVRGAYFAPAYTWLLAGGGVAIERWVNRGRFRWVVPAALLILLPLQSIRAIPLVMPVFPPADVAAHSLATNAGRQAEERAGIGALPEFLGHMSGWRELVGQLHAVHASLPASEQRQAAIILPDYGMAAAVDVLGRDLGLPRAMSGHNNYWVWGPGTSTFDVAIAVGVSERRLREWFEEVTPAGNTHCVYCLPYENRPIHIARRPRVAVSEIWPRLKTFN